MLSDESAVKVSDMDIEVSTATAKALFDWAVENALFIHANHQPPKYFKQSYIECLLRLALHFGGDHESVGLTVYLSKAYNIFLQNESNAKNTQDIIKKYLPARGSKQDRILTGEKSKRVRTVKDTYNVVSDRLKKLELRSDFAAKRFPLSGKSWKQVLVILKIVNLNVLGSKNKHTVVSANSSNIQPFNSEEFLCITRHAKYDNVFAAKYKYGGKDFVIKFTDNENDERRELELSTKYNICDCIVVANRVYDVSQEDLCNVFGMSKEEALNFRHGFLYPAYPATLAQVFMQLGTTGVEMPMVQKDALAYMVLHVLSVLHSGGYAYLDVKPENIVLCLDFSDFLSKSPREIFKALPGLDAQSEGDGDEANLLSETSSAWKFTVQHPLIKFIDTMSVTPFGSTIDDAAVTFAYCPILEDTTVVSPKLDFHPAAMILCQIYLGEDIVPAELLAGVSISQATALKNHAWRDGIKKRWHQRLSCKNERHVGSLGDGIIN